MSRKILRKSQPGLKHYVKKIEAQTKKWFSYEKTCNQSLTLRCFN